MSLRLRFPVCLVIGAVFLLSTAAIAGGPQIKKTSLGTGAKVGFGEIKYHHTCVWFRVLFISGDFFKDLQGQETPNGIKFRNKKNKTTYTSFPDPLIVAVEAIPLKCNPLEMPPDYASGLMEAPSFEVAWKGGDETRRVGLLGSEEHHYPRYGFAWTYFLTVPSAAVPLTDSLVIDVSLRHGICQTQLTANLDPRKQHVIIKTCDFGKDGDHD
jgi:hypothetical protein